MNTKAIRILAISIALVAISSAGFAQRTDGCTCGVPSQVPTPFLIRHSNPLAQQAAMDAFNTWNLYVDIFRPTIGAPVDYALGNSRNEILFYDFSQEPGLDPNSVVGYAPHLPDTAFGSFNACPAPLGNSCGTFTESDVWLNEIIDWTVDRPNVDNPSDYGYYASTAIHEIGHTFGMHHNFKNVSTMNYYQDYAGLYVSRADVLAVRKAFPSQTRQVFDLGIYPFTYNDTDQPSSHGNDAVTPANVDKSQVAPGGKIVIRNWTIENLSNSSQVARIRFYLSTDTNITTSDIDLGGLRWDPLNTWAQDVDGTEFTIPTNVPNGSYYVGAITGTGANGTALQADQIPYNNTFYVPGKITVGAVGQSTCSPNDTTMCLIANRFSVTMTWNDGGAQSGAGHAIRFSDASGFFWFSSSDNLEVLFKILNTCGISGLNNKFWVFGAAATTLAYDITITDTHTGQRVVKHHDNGSPAVAIADINAFATCGQ